MEPRANWGLGETRKRTSSAGRGLRDHLRLHLPVSQEEAEQWWRYLTVVTNAADRADRDLSQSTIKDPVSIQERPENVDARTEGSHWEGDLFDL
jgi:IS30 family transposase